jgi:hypothetical protein
MDFETIIQANSEKTTTLAVNLRYQLSRGWIDPVGKKEAEALHRALNRYLKAIGEQ